MTDFKNGNDGEIPLEEAIAFAGQLSKYLNVFYQLRAENEKLMEENREKDAKIEEQQEMIERLKGELDQSKKVDEWADRLTFDAVVEEIASNEDAAQRDNARKLIEPLLKKSQVTQLRKDIKRRVKELNEDSAGGVNFNNYGTYTEVHSGGININNKKDAGH